MDRRLFLASSAALAALPRAALAQDGVTFLTKFVQGGLVVAKTEPGADAWFNSRALKVTGDGMFAFGFEYDDDKISELAIKYPSGATQVRNLGPPEARQYEIQRINGLPPQEAHPSAPDIVERIRKEHALVGEARKTDSDRTDFLDAFDWPARGIVSGVFGSQRILNGVPSAPHFGVDIAGGEGAAIHAPAGATVLLAEQFFLEGGYTLLDHGHGVFTGYMHQSKQLVKAGDRVERGQQLGNIGHTGRATGPHLHWQMNWFNVRLDPSLSTRTPAPEKI
ncbi:MAG TPA: M23 family metallopeptidase [Rhizomicrobium sp.]|jgi:murein DD-endopeptidase MepM/ murein hydrolase activator NlpD